MTGGLSARLQRVVDALPLRPGMRVLEIGGAPGAAAREVAARVGPSGHVLVLDRSQAGIRRTQSTCWAAIEGGVLSTMCAPVERFKLDPETELFDLAFACRVGALDGRHPLLFDAALSNISRAVVPGGALYIDTGSPLTAIAVDSP